MKIHLKTKTMSKLQRNAEALAEWALKIGAIKINPKDPFKWASGWRSPIYNDNRMSLGYPEMFQRVVESFSDLLSETFQGDWKREIDVIMGTSTAGIPHATILAYLHGLPFGYIRDKAKDHGLKNRIEGIDVDKDLSGKRVLLIEDLISTGGSSVSAVQAIRNANGKIDHCISIFNYGFPKAKEMFAGNASFSKDGVERLSEPCQIYSLLDYPTLLEVAIKVDYISEEDRAMLDEWSKDPESWSNNWKSQNEKVSA